MAEPLFILADIEISVPALRRWLKSAPLSPATFDDWPESLFHSGSGISHVAEPTQPSVIDELITYCVDSFGLGDGHLHFKYDEQSKALHFAVCSRYGDEKGVMESAIFLCALLRGLAQVYTAKKRLLSACLTQELIYCVSRSPGKPRVFGSIRRMIGYLQHGLVSGSARTTWATRPISWQRCFRHWRAQ
ncbi:hypothetical protein [Paraburkholderia adhaesiva]|uniref:hypothetical protein n=1 Tax=Paraburkholderia adhaesiva TaxID=2883244 RepID=UPI001F1F3977|nr:hypothetical protein [Paraburkholderia adhaesiva]